MEIIVCKIISKSGSIKRKFATTAKIEIFSTFNLFR